MNTKQGKPEKHLDDVYLFFVEAMKDGAVIMRPDYTITFANRGFYTMVGYREGTAIGTSLLEYIHEADIPLIHNICTGHQKLQKTEIIMKTAKGIYIATYVSAALLQSEGKDVICMVFSDLSEHRLTRELLAKDEFISIASHELKTHLTTVRAFTQLLVKYFSARGDEKAIDYLRRMDKQLNRLTDLVGNLLDISRIQSGKMIFNEESFSVNTLIDEIVSDITMTTGTHIFIRKESKDVSIVADRYRIGQVLENIIRNAMKYSPRSRDIVIRTAIKGDRVIISVQDFGIGIPSGQRERYSSGFTGQKEKLAAVTRGG